MAIMGLCLLLLAPLGRPRGKAQRGDIGPKQAKLQRRVGARVGPGNGSKCPPKWTRLGGTTICDEACWTAALEGIPQRRPFFRATSIARSSTPGRATQREEGGREGGISFQVQGPGTAQVRPRKGMPRLVASEGCEGMLCPILASHFICEPMGCCMGMGMGMMDGMEDGGWRGSLPEVIIVVQPAPRCSFNVFWSFSPLCLFLLSTGSYLVFILFIRFIPTTRPCWRRSEKVESTPSQHGTSCRRQRVLPFLNICYRPLRDKTPTGNRNYLSIKEELDAEHDKGRKEKELDPEDY